ncbi:MAG TPA: nucleotide sugar dehydrogenase [Candidatus Bathyarchaeia archaeon]|nr:nucleotide sugar dehydrogenase [Candidatus Bathyarchaeia archaeon]
MDRVLASKIKNRKAKIAILGLGYVGLPLAVNFAKVGFKVFGIDKDRDRVNRVALKKSYIADIPTKELERVVSSGRLSATLDFSVIAQVDAVIICVPTPIKRKYTPDVSYITSAVDELEKYVRKGTLVVMESTTYPGTTRELIKPRLEKEGLKAGKDFFLAFSPERIDPGNKTYDVTRIPKVVGGLTQKCTRLTAMLYQTIIKEIHTVSSPEAAEMTKLLENSFRIINIGWINEVAMMSRALGIDVWEVIAAAKTKPFGFMPFYPGLGVGGHCIPEDPLYLYWQAKRYGFRSKYIKLSADTNANMPAYVIGRIETLLNGKKKKLASAKILVMGVTYKKDVKDLRKSPSLKLMGLLQNRVKCVDYHDPFIPYLEIFNIHQKESISLTPAAVKKYDCVIIATDHSKVNYDLLRRHAKMIFDTRHVYARGGDKKIETL